MGDSYIDVNPICRRRYQTLTLSWRLHRNAVNSVLPGRTGEGVLNHAFLWIRLLKSGIPSLSAAI